MKQPTSRFDSVMDVVLGSAASGAGGNTTVTLTVPKGEIWEVLHGLAYHDDAARSAQYSMSDGTDTSVLGNAISIGTSVPIFLFGSYDGTNYLSAWAGAPVLRYGQSITISVLAMAASKNVYLKLVVNKLRGAELWA